MKATIAHSADFKSDTGLFKGLVDRYVRLRAYSLLALSLVVLALLVVLIWRNLARFETVHSYVEYSHLIQQANFDLQRVLADHFRGLDSPSDPQRMARLSAELDNLAHHDGHVDVDTPPRLALARDKVRLAERSTTRANKELLLLEALDANSAMLDAETLAREKLLEEIADDTRTEVILAAVIVLVILGMSALYLRKRVWRPLHELRGLLTRLAQEDYSPITTQHQLDPLLLTVFDSYNEMVTRLAELEEAKRNYAAALEADVRAATQTLLQQHSSLAKSERLAALGELGAGIAHELRNPLAGILLTCSNLREENQNPDHVARLELVIGELKRMSKLLNQFLGNASEAPEPLVACDIGRVTHELVALTRYQVPASVVVHIDIPAGLRIRLPESRLRQALLNLMINSAAALGGKAGNIWIAATINQEESAQLTVTDDGRGFSRELLQNGIRSFATSRGDEGTGLGLVMVRRFVQDVGGKFTIANARPNGAQVTLEFPALLLHSVHGQ